MNLNKSCLILMASLAFSVGVNAQKDKVANRLTIEPYVGYITGDYENRVFSQHATNLSVPLSVGNRVEFNLTKRFSLGLDVNYANVKIGWNDTYYNLSGSYHEAQLFKGPERHEKSVEKFRIMLRFKTYFIKNDSWTGYVVYGAGSKFVRQTDLITGLPIEEERVPLTQRIGVGFGHYFTSNLGCSLELGLGGGSPIQFGLSIRL